MSALTTLLSLVKTTASGVTGLDAARVFRGRKVYAEGDTTLENAVRALNAQSQGVFIFWKGPRSIQDRVKPGQVVIYGKLFVYRPKDTTDELASEDAFAESLAVALSDLTTFAASRVLNIVYECGDDGLEDGIAEYDFEMTYQVSACS